MALRAIRLQDEPNRFDFKLGDKVVTKNSEGYADPDYAGIVTDGVWEGESSGGAYKVRYRVKRDKGGGLFEAEELQLLKHYEDETALRSEIRERLRTHQLPRSLPPGPEGQLQGRETMREGGRGNTCSACGHRISPSDALPLEYEYPSSVVFRFHTRCNGIWLEEKGH